MSNSQHDGPDDQVPAIPLAPGAGVPPVPDAEAAPVPPVVTEGDTQAPVNPYVQPPANVYTQNPVNPYVEPTQNPYAPPAAAEQPQAQAPYEQAQAQPAPYAPPQPNEQPQPYEQQQYAQQPYAQPYAQPYQQQQYAQQPYAQPQQASAPYAPPPQYPTDTYGAPAYASPQGPSRFNVLGLISLIAGGIALLFGFVFSWIPFVGFAFVVLSLIGVGLGVFGLLQKQKSKGLAVAGTVVSGVALLATAAISIIMLIVFNSIASYVPTEPYDPADPGGSGIEEPIEVDPDAHIAQPGDVLTFADYDGNDEWQIVVGTPNLDATEEVLAASEYNRQPSAGSQYIIVPVTFTFLGAGSDEPFMVFTDLITANGELIYLDFAEYPGSMYDAEELSTGESAELNLVFEIATADVPGSMLAVGTVWTDDTYVMLD